MILINCDILINYLEQKKMVIIANSCVNDFFDSIDAILDNSMACSEGNFSILKEMLNSEIGKFMERVSEAGVLLEECGLKTRFEESTVFYNNNGEYVIEIIARAYVEDYEGLFSIEREKKIMRSFPQVVHEESRVLEYPNSSS